jgi:hypothetical protein
MKGQEEAGEEGAILDLTFKGKLRTVYLCVHDEQPQR